MKKLLLIIAVLLFCWSCDVPGNLTYDGGDSEESRTLDFDDDGEIELIQKPNFPERPVYPSLTFPKPIPSDLPDVRVQLFKHNYFVEPLTVEGTTNMISGFKYLSSSASASSIWGLSNLCDYNFNDEMSSIRIYNDTNSIVIVYFYEHSNYGGEKDSITVRPGKSEEIVSLKRESMNMWTSWNDDITSLKIVVERPYTVEYCIDPHACNNLYRCYQSTCFKPSCFNLNCNLDFHCHNQFCCHSPGHCHNDCATHPCRGHKKYL